MTLSALTASANQMAIFLRRLATQSPPILGYARAQRSISESVPIPRSLELFDCALRRAGEHAAEPHSAEPFCQFADVLFALLGQWDVGSTSVLAKERLHPAC